MADKNKTKGDIKCSKLNEYEKQEFNTIKNLEDDIEEKNKLESISEKSHKFDGDSNSSISISSSSYNDSIHNFEN